MDLRRKNRKIIEYTYREREREREQNNLDLNDNLYFKVVI